MGRPALSLYISQGAQTKKVVGSQWPINCLSWWCSVQEGERKRQSGEIVQYALVVSKSNCPLQHWQGISQLERRSQFPWVLPFIGYISCSGTLERDLHVPDSYHFYKNRKRSWRLEMFLSIFLVNLASKTLSAFLPCVISEINNSEGSFPTALSFISFSTLSTPIRYFDREALYLKNIKCVIEPFANHGGCVLTTVTLG